MTTSYDALLIGGRAGVGKSTVGYEVSAQLPRLLIAHCYVEGDNLAEVPPPPPGGPPCSALAAANLGAIWVNVAAAGYRRLVYTNTVSVLDSEWVPAAMGRPTQLVRVLLTATDDTAAERLRRRGGGHQSEGELGGGRGAAARG